MPVFHYLPQAVVCAIIFVAALELVLDFKDVKVSYFDD